MDLTIYGHSETDCLNHSVAWMNFALESHARVDADRIKLRERFRLQAAMLSGVMFNDPAQGNDLYEQMMGQLSDNGEDESDDAWLLNPDAKMTPDQISQLERTIARRIDDQRQRGLRNDDPHTGTP